MVINRVALEHVIAGTDLFPLSTVVEKAKEEQANNITVERKHKCKVSVNAEIMSLVLRVISFIFSFQLELLSCSRLDEYWLQL